VKLLFDQNLSPRLVDRLADLYPDSVHVSTIGLDCASDDEVWEYARQSDCFIVTKDVDYSDFSLIRGFPPRTIWLRLGNCSTREVEAALRLHYRAIQVLSNDPQAGVLTVL